MTDARWWLADLLLAGILTAVGAMTVFLQPGGPVQVALGLPLLVFLPGYALVSAMFPSASPAPSTLPSFDETVGSGNRESAIAGLGVTGRIGLSVVLSAAIVPLVVLAANVSPVGLALRPVLGGVGAVTAGLLLIATARRLRMPSRERFAMRVYVPPAALFWTDDSHRFNASPLNATVPNVVLLVGVLLLATSVGYAAISPPAAESSTSFRVGTQEMTGDTQTLYRSSLPRGETTPVEVVVTNHEGERTDFTVVALLQRVETTGGSVSVRESAVVGQRDLTVPDGRERRVDVEVTPSMDGDTHRLSLLLYRDGAPADPSPENAYRTLRLAVTLDGSGGGDG